MKICLLFAMVLLGAFGAVAQSIASTCPKIEVTGPSGVTQPGDTMTFTVNPNVPDFDKLKFKWTVSAGIIEEGQDKSFVVVRGPDSDEVNVTATVEVEGLPTGCENTGSETAGFARGCGLPPIVDEYGKITFGQEKARLDNAAIQVRDARNSRLVLIVRSPKTVSKAAQKLRIANISKYLQLRGLTKDQFLVVQAGSDINSTTIYLVPSGSEVPLP